MGQAGDVLAVVKAGLEGMRKLAALPELHSYSAVLADLNAALLQTQTLVFENGDLRETIRELGQQIAELEQKLVVTADLVFYRGLYYSKVNDGKLDAHPYCSNCREVQKHLVHLTWEQRQAGWRCPQCSNTYRGPDYINRGQPFLPQ